MPPLSKLDELCKNDEALRTEVLGLFFETTQADIAALLAADSAHNTDAIVRIAHHLKGSALTLGAEGLAATAADIERAPEQAHQIAPRLQQQLQHIQRFYLNA